MADSGNVVFHFQVFPAIDKRCRPKENLKDGWQSLCITKSWSPVQLKIKIIIIIIKHRTNQHFNLKNARQLPQIDILTLPFPIKKKKKQNDLCVPNRFLHTSDSKNGATNKITTFVVENWLGFLPKDISVIRVVNTHHCFITGKGFFRLQRSSLLKWVTIVTAS